jgi:ribosomal protein S14
LIIPEQQRISAAKVLTELGIEYKTERVMVDGEEARGKESLLINHHRSASLDPEHSHYALRQRACILTGRGSVIIRQPVFVALCRLVVFAAAKLSWG